MSLSSTVTHEDAPSPAGPAAQQARGSWLDRFLPARGFEGAAFLVLVALVLGLKLLAIYHLRSDSDETQHAHVVWEWVRGRLQYRDFFDNHMPLFQMACAPLMGLIGERADVMIWLRWAMLPLYLVSLWTVFRLGVLLYSRRVALWSTLSAAVLWKYVFTSTEFRTDQLWAAFWLLSLLVAVSGKFTMKRALGFGMLVGLAFAVSLKTVALILGLGSAAAVAMALAWRRGGRPALLPAAAPLAAILAGTLIPPAAMVYYFWRQGAYPIMVYCVIWHNLVPGLKRWGSFSLHEWYYPLSLAVLGACGWLIFRQTPDTRLAVRRTIILLTPWFFLFLLSSYWPDITREDDLPYVSLTPLSLMPLLILAGALTGNKQWRRHLWTYGMPALVLYQCLLAFQLQKLRENRLQVTTHNIADVLALTKPDDYVMDDKGDYVYRRRAYYWVLEPITKARVRMGAIHDTIPDALIGKGVKICSMECGKPGSLAAQFIVANYLPFDAETRKMGVLGKVIGKEGDTYSFDIVIPQTYAVVTESGQLAGELDGKPYTEAVWLSPGRHEFRRTSGSGRVAIMLNDAHSKGFSPLYDMEDLIVREIGTLPKGKKAEIQ
jgi:hypothetical protein